MAVAKWKGDHASVIEVLVKENPKRVGSQAQQRFSLYKSGMTVADYIQRCKARKSGEDGLGSIRWDQDHHFIKVWPPGSRLG